MRLERRIREGAERNAAVLEPNVEGSFSTVVREARRRRRVRLTFSSLVTMSLIAAAIVVGPGILDGMRAIRTQRWRLSRRRSRPRPQVKALSRR